MLPKKWKLVQNTYLRYIFDISSWNFWNSFVIYTCIVFLSENSFSNKMCVDIKDVWNVKFREEKILLEEGICLWDLQKFSVLLLSNFCFIFTVNIKNIIHLFIKQTTKMFCVRWIFWKRVGNRVGGKLFALQIEII